MVNIKELEKNYFLVDTSGHICKIYYKKINDKISVSRLDYWFDKSTKRQKTYKNKLFDHMRHWACYMVDEYYKKEI